MKFTANKMHKIALSILLVALVAVLSVNAAATPKRVGESKQLFGAFGGAQRNYCPLCDSSVYSYCHHKLFHDSCCCSGQFGQQGSFQCLQMDCSYLHANTCREYALIAECCCDD